MDLKDNLKLNCAMRGCTDMLPLNLGVVLTPPSPSLLSSKSRGEERSRYAYCQGGD